MRTTIALYLTEAATTLARLEAEGDQKANNGEVVRRQITSKTYR
jgi:hypothetical protein